MVRHECVICKGKGIKADAYHEFKDGYEYFHFCDSHFWDIFNYFSRKKR